MDNIAELLTSWSDVNWQLVNKNVKRLRGRIFQARLENDMPKLRSLQRLMLKSKSNYLFSIRSIGSNSGKKTCGIDGDFFTCPADKFKLFQELSRDGIRGRDAKPARRIYIKEPTKLRPIGIPTIYDRVVQTITLNALEPEWEAVFEKGSYGFRPKRNVDDAVARLFLALNKGGGRKWIVDTDISKCFDSITHGYIIDKVKGFPGRDLIVSWLKSGIIIRNIWFDSGEEGTPQGSAISPLLCNISLHGLESELGVEYDNRGYVKSKGRLLIRFADDLVILCHTREDAELALSQLSKALKPRGLEVSDTKTKIVHITEGFDFLGFNFKLKPKRHIHKSKCLSVDTNDIRVNQDLMGIYINPSLKSLKKVKSNIKEIFKKYNSNMTKVLIRKVNEVIRGYVQSKWHWHSGEAFSHLNFFLFRKCWSWAKRRHPKMSSNWIMENYFTTLKRWNMEEKWVFHARLNKPGHDKIHETYMFKCHWFRIRNHILARIDKLPDNKMDSKYFSDLSTMRLKSRPFNILFRLDKELADSQESLCPVCNNDLFNGQVLNIHHIIPKEEGGLFTFSNLVLVHYFCHKEIHTDIDYYKVFLFDYRVNHPRLNYKAGKNS